MIRYKQFIDPAPKLNARKNDLAPMLFFFDIVKTDNFSIPIMPIPMRIDKLTNGQPTLFLKPNKKILNDTLEELDLTINFKHFYLNIIKNLIIYAEKVYKKITYRTLNKAIINKWFVKSINLKVKIPSLVEDYTFLLIEFLKLYSKIMNNNILFGTEEYNSELINYCDKAIDYFRNIIENNKNFIIMNKNDEQKEYFILKKKKKNILLQSSLLILF